MKWAMIVSFYLAGEWHTAEQLHMRDWYRTIHDNAELCIQAVSYTHLTLPTTPYV